MIESTAIRYFRAVTERGSIKRAADSLHIAPSAISRQIQSLEEELAARLFERGARGMSLTGAGNLLYRYAAESQTRLEDIRAQMEAFDTLQRGHVKIATVEGLLASFLSDFVADVANLYPGLSMSVTTVGSRAVADMISRHEVDLGFVFGPAPRRDLIELAHMRQSLYVMVAPHHSLAGQPHCTIKDCAGLQVVLPDPSFGIRQEIDRACAQANIQLDIKTETNSLAFARATVARTGWATFLPREAATPELSTGMLIAIPLRGKRLEAMQATLVQAASRNPSASAARIAQLLAASMKDRSD